MCGIAGAVDLKGRRRFPLPRLSAMLAAIAHRGPDDAHTHREDGVALGARRLAFMDVAGGRQPMSNETGTVWAAQDGEVYEYAELRRDLQSNGHVLTTACDTEAWVHLYEESGERVFRRARGQYAVSLWDRDSRTLLLGRDRAGIAPLFYAEADGWLVWASEIKALFASGLIEAKADRRGVDTFFNFYALGGERTCFAGIRQVPPGHYLKIRGGDVRLVRHADLDYPADGEERTDLAAAEAAEALETLLGEAVRRRLSGDGEACCYLSGGLDSAMILALASGESDAPVRSATVSLDGAGPDEGAEAGEAARFAGSDLMTLRMTSADICEALPALIAAAESPVLDVSAACMVRLAATVRAAGFKKVLSGEGADEILAGYSWFKARADGGPGGSLKRALGRAFPRAFAAAGESYDLLDRIGVTQQTGHQLIGASRAAFYSSAMWDAVDGYSAYDELNLDTARLRRWHPLNRSLYFSSKVMLPGMLLAAKGDRAAHSASLEGRFPYLDERVVDFCADLPPAFKLNGSIDKWLLRNVARSLRLSGLADRRKAPFHANVTPLLFGGAAPQWVDQLLSADSIAATGYFDHAGVQGALAHLRQGSADPLRRSVYEVGLTGVLTTQLWHHTFLGGGLSGLPCRASDAAPTPVSP